ncbi:MAG: Spy/CpxP family protein refolding chaperone [Rhodoplanes sp.]
MKKSVLVIGGIATAVVLAGGWALAQSLPHGPGDFGPPFMRGEGAGGMGPGMMRHMGRMMGPGMHRGMGPGMMRGAPGLTFADPMQIETVKKELGITALQEPAWTKYTKAIQDAATAMKTTREGVDPDAVSKMTPQDRFAFITKMREQGQKQFETVQTAATELFASFDDGQKTKARDILPGLASFGPGPMRGAFMGGPWHRQ